MSLFSTPLNFRWTVPLKVANLNQANILGRRIQQQRERVRAKAIRRGGGGQSSLWSKIQTPRQTRPPRRRNSRWKNLPKWQFITFFKMCITIIPVRTVKFLRHFQITIPPLIRYRYLYDKQGTSRVPTYRIVTVTTYRYLKRYR